MCFAALNRVVTKDKGLHWNRLLKLPGPMRPAAKPLGAIISAIELVFWGPGPLRETLIVYCLPLCTLLSGHYMTYIVKTS